MSTYEFISKDITEEGTLIKIHGAIDSHTNEQFNQDVHRLLDRERHKLIFDFSDVEHLSSRGIGSMFSFLKRCKSNDGNIVLINPSKTVINTLELLKASEVFPTVTAEDAIERAMNPDEAKHQRLCRREFAHNESITLIDANEMSYVMLVTDTSQMGLGCVFCGDPPPEKELDYKYNKADTDETYKAVVRWVRNLEGNIYRVGVQLLED